MSTTAAPPAPSALPAERFFRGSIFFLAFTAIATLISTGKLDLFTCVLAPIALLYKGFRWWHNAPPEISHRLATRLVLSYLAIFPMDIFFFSRMIAATSNNPALYAALLGAVHFLLFVMIVRLYSTTTDRDTVFLALLAFAAMLAAAILTIDTSFLVLFFFFLLFAVAAFLAMELRRGADGALSSAPQIHSRQDRRLSRALSFAALSVAVGAGVIGGMLFFVFPRFSAGYFSRASLQPQLMSGFSNDVELGQIGEIKQSSAVTMRVKTGKPVSYAMLRWRGIALSTFDGKRWSTPRDDQKVIGASSDGWIPLVNSLPKIDKSTATLEYTVLLQPMASDAIFTAGNALAIRGDFSGGGSTSFSNAQRSYLFDDFTDSLSNPSHNYEPLRYLGYSILPVTNPEVLRHASTDYPREISNAYLQLPVLDKRVPELARNITAQAHTPYDQAVAMERYLRAHFAYTLKLSGKPGEDPLAYFLFESRAGHCEYFASSMAILLRTLGIPTREVNGFLPGEFNDLGGDYIVRASDAHSWVEVYFPGNGWVTFDPTPASTQTSGFFSRFNQYIDWMQLSWNEWIINYDFAHQLQVARGMQRNTHNWKQSADNWFNGAQRKSKQWMKSWQARYGVLGVVLPLVLVLLLAMLRSDVLVAAFRRLRLYLQMRDPDSARANPQLASRLYAELLRILERRGFARQPSQTPLEFADAVATPGLKLANAAGAPDLAPAVREFTLLYAHARFGGVPCDIPRLRHLLDRIRTS